MTHIAILKIGNKRATLWKDHMSALLPDFKFFLDSETIDKKSVEFAIVWKPKPGWLKTFPNLKCIISVGSGIDHILNDPQLPTHIPIIRTTGKDLSTRMREYVVLHVLRLHRNLQESEAGQKFQEWRQIIEPPANQRNIGIMGLGNLGADCARTLSTIGFNVSGWSRSEKKIESITCFWGADGRNKLLEKSHIIVCMLPLTPHTEGILNSELFSHLPKGASIINVARGEHLVEADLLKALSSGQLSAATLDVFREEPLPQKHPFWDHKNILVTPHVASLIDPVAGGKSIAKNLKNFIRGVHIENLIPPGKDY